jgi:hypothetical protein
VEVIAPWFHRPKRNRGKIHPRTYDVTVQYERDQIDFEETARRLGQDDMGAFFHLTARITCWLLMEQAFRNEEAEGRKEQERCDQEQLQVEERRLRARWDRESKRSLKRELDLDRREQELARRERDLQEREGS